MSEAEDREPARRQATPVVRTVGPPWAAQVRDIIVAAFAARPTLDPPSTATAETDAGVAEVLGRYGGLLATVEGHPAGALLLGRGAEGDVALRRVAVLPHMQGQGVATALAEAAEEVAVTRGARRTVLDARLELPATVDFWRHRGYATLAERGHTVVLGKVLPVALARYALLGTADTEALGRGIAALLRPGDLVVLSGELGAGKTALTRGIGAGLGVRGAVTSPTFVISRVHPPTGAGPALVHVDAYRLGGLEELEDLDLDASLASSVTVVEWGEGLVEGLSQSRLEVRLRRPASLAAEPAAHAPTDEPRAARLTAVGERWRHVDLSTLR